MSFELPRVKLQEMYRRKSREEKLILVRVSTRFELARDQVIGSQQQ